MKTTIELPDNLVVAAKQQAAARRTTLKALIEAGLRHELAAGGMPGAKLVKIRWVTVKGGLPPNADISDRSRMTEWMTREKTKLRRGK